MKSLFLLLCLHIACNEARSTPKREKTTLSGVTSRLLRKEVLLRNSLVGKVGKTSGEEKAALRASAKRAVTALRKAEESANELKKKQADLQDKQRELAKAKIVETKLLGEMTLLAKQLAIARTSLSSNGKQLQDVSSQLNEAQKTDTAQTQKIQALRGQLAKTQAAVTVSKKEALKRQSIIVRATKELSKKYDDRLRAKDQVMRAIQRQLTSEEEHDRSMETAESEKQQLTALRRFSESKEQEVLALRKDAMAKERAIGKLQAKLVAAKMMEEQQKEAAAAAAQKIADAVGQNENAALRKELRREVEVLQKARMALEYKDRMLKKAHSELEAENKEIKALRKAKARAPHQIMQWNANMAHEEGSRDDTQIGLEEGHGGTSGRRTEGDEVSSASESGGETFDGAEASIGVAAESEEQSAAGGSSDDEDAAHATEEQASGEALSEGSAHSNEEQQVQQQQEQSGESVAEDSSRQQEQAEGQNEEGGQSYSGNARGEEVQGDTERESETENAARGGETEGNADSNSADSEDSSSDSDADRAVLEELNLQA